MKSVMLYSRFSKSSVFITGFWSGLSNTLYLMALADILPLRFSNVQPPSRDAVTTHLLQKPPL